MERITRREFIKTTIGLGSFLFLPRLNIKPASDIITIPLPSVSNLDDPLLIRIVDSNHPYSEAEISKSIEPNLVEIKLSMDGILVANEHVRVNRICLPALEELFVEANLARTGLYIHSGFRTYEEQAIAYSHANDKSTVLKPGTSQHHTGLAIDFTSSEIGKTVDVNSRFETTKAGKWINDHAWEYGFAQSYNSSHDDIRNESWHFLYIGKPLANTYRVLKSAGWYGDIFLLQLAMNLGMTKIVFDQE